MRTTIYFMAAMWIAGFLVGVGTQSRFMFVDANPERAIERLAKLPVVDYEVRVEAKTVAMPDELARPTTAVDDTTTTGNIEITMYYAPLDILDLSDVSKFSQVYVDPLQTGWRYPAGIVTGTDYACIAVVDPELIDAIKNVVSRQLPENLP